MADTLTMHEASIRFIAFISILLLMIVWEILAPRRVQRVSRALRWANNLGLVVLNTLLLRLLFPLAAVGAAVFAEQYQFGLFHYVTTPPALALILSLLLLDLLIYFQHRVFHRVPWLWRLHRMHHADQEFDVTTGLRFHPVEILLSMVIKLSAVALLGAPVVAVIIFEVVLNGTALFNHGNVRLPAWLDRRLRLILVTPDMHRVHHSAEPDETNSNYGFSVSWWDRLFKTYRAETRAGQLKFLIGLHEFRTTRDQRLDQMLFQPFRRRG